MAEAKWYIVHTQTGYEDTVARDIEKTSENSNLRDRILEVRVPKKKVIIHKDGKVKEKEEKLYPGFVMIHMVLDEQTWYVARNARGVRGYVGPGGKPAPLTEEEIANMGLEPVEEEIFDFQLGDLVQVISGPWAGTNGVIKSINQKNKKAVINCDMFGRETPVELKFTEFKKY
ncbi:MAG: transcription termination/antitermination protein NusG [Lachnospiraceae bacterium]|nr:transcription termination/antitermination protein NusG [Lachnospiraceae bacterium]